MNTRKLSIFNLVTVAAILLVSATMLVPVGAANIGVTGFQTPPMSNFVPSQMVVGATASDEPYPSPYPANYIPSSGDTNFRIAHMWNGIFIPSMDVTSLLALPAAGSSSSTDDNFRIAHTWNGIFIPSMDVTSLLAP